MAKVNDLLSDRLKKKEHDSAKMHALAERSTTGQLSGFSGVFQVTKLNKEEQDKLKNILYSHKEESNEIDTDLLDLIAITAEVKAINSQAIILHGERIKKAQTVLKKYKDGAFTEWLIHTYGNRQTPYNFLQYYEFYMELSQDLRQIAQEMPKQAIYTLASREASINKKIEIVKNYSGESKEEMLKKIRKTFPLIQSDKRKSNHSYRIIKALEALNNDLKSEPVIFSKEERKQVFFLLKELKNSIQNLDSEIHV